VPAKKPAPDIYDWALEQMDLKPEEAIAFEDSSNGIKSSAAANVKTIITINEYTKDDDFSAADLVLDQMGDESNGFKVLSGNVDGHSFLNLELVHKVHAA